MGIKRVVATDFWNDEKVINMFSPEDKLFMLYLLTNPHTTQLGIYRIVPKQAAFEIGYSTDTVSVLLDRFENKYEVIKYSKATSEIAIKNFLRHSIIKGGKPVEDLLTKEIVAVKDKSLLQFVYNEIHTYEDLNDTVKKMLSFLNVNDNDNDNDNDVSWYDSCNDSCNDSVKQKSKPARHKYGEYDNVLLSDEDFEKLKAEFSKDYQERIERLSFYIASTGKVYKNHLATIRNWARKETPRKTYGANGVEISPAASNDLDDVF